MLDKQKQKIHLLIQHPHLPCLKAKSMAGRARDLRPPQEAGGRAVPEAGGQAGTSI
jgi:hypothetical protein